MIVTPPPSMPGIIHECGEERRARRHRDFGRLQGDRPRGRGTGAPDFWPRRRQANMRIIGPNCLGVMSPLTGLNATFATTIARPGNRWASSARAARCARRCWIGACKEMVGFSAFVSVGSMVDVGWGDLIYYLGNDPQHPQSIVIYMESIGDARALPLGRARSGAQQADHRHQGRAQRRPPPRPPLPTPARSPAATKCWRPPSGAAACCASNNIADLFYMAEVLSKQPRPKGPRLTIVTNAGGPGVLATDALIMPAAASWPRFRRKPWKRSTPSCPPPGATTIRSISSATPRPERYAKALEIAAKDPNSDGMLVILTPQAMTDPTQIAEQLKPLAKLEGKPHAGKLDGRRGCGRGRSGILNQRQHSHLPVSRYRRARLQLTCGSTATTCRACTKRRRCRKTPPTGRADRNADRRDHPECAGRRPHHPHRSPNPSRCWPLMAFPPLRTVVARDAGSGRRTAAERDRLSGGAEAVFRNHHPQDRRGRRAVESGRAARPWNGLRGDRDVRDRKGRRAAFPGRHRAAHDQARAMAMS